MGEGGDRCGVYLSIQLHTHTQTEGHMQIHVHAQTHALMANQ